MIDDECWREQWHRYYRNKTMRTRLTVWRNPVDQLWYWSAGKGTSKACESRMQAQAQAEAWIRGQRA